jgi:uncharacterized protein YjiS (DUF1127 family)
MLVAGPQRAAEFFTVTNEESRMTSKKQIAPTKIDQGNSAQTGRRRPTVLASGDIARFLDRFDLQSHASYSSEWIDARRLPANEWAEPTDSSGGADETAHRTDGAHTETSHGARRWSAILAGFVARAWQAYRHEREIARAIAYLSTLNDHTLRDIGLHRSEIEEAVRRGRR